MDGCASFAHPPMPAHAPVCVTPTQSKEVLGFAPPAYTLINCGLVLLYCINLYWFGLILRIAWAKVTTGQTRDIREDEDEEEEDQKPHRD